MKIPTLTIVVIFAFLFSSFTLWLMEYWIKYPLFLFEAFAIITLYLIVSKHDVKVTIKRMKMRNLNASLVIDLLLAISASLLLMFDILGIRGELSRSFLALLCTSLLPGYALLNIFRIAHYFTKLEGVLLSYILSYTYTGLLVLALLPINENIRGTMILFSYIVLGTLSAFKHLSHSQTFIKESFARRVDILAILLSMVFYILSFYFIYPSFALLPGTDISRHYAWSVVLWRTPELYSAYQYFLAHLHEAAFVNLSKASLATVKMTLVLLNLTMPLAFYAMAKSYTENIDKRLSAISTIFYSIFSGFAWIYLVRLKLSGTQGSQLSLLGIVNDKAYNGAMYLAQPFLCYVPLSFSFTIFITQLMLLRKLEIKERDFVIIFSLLLMASYMSHITEAVVLTLFLSFYALFSRSKEIRIDDAIKASIISFASLLALYTILQYGFAVKMTVPLTGGPFLIITLLLPMTTLAVVYAFRKLSIQDRLIRSFSRLAVKPFIITIFYAISFIYILGLLMWIAGVQSFSTKMVVDVGLVPWFMYPVILGVPGLLMLISTYYLIQNHKGKMLLIPFIALIIFSLIFGRILTFININFFDVGYWEKRFTAYLHLASATIAPVAIVRLFESRKLCWFNIKKTIIVAIIVCLIVICGLQSTFTVVEYWNAMSVYKPSQEEMDAVKFLANILKNDKYAYTITLTQYSYDVLAFSAPPYRLTGMQIVYTAKNPEMVLLSAKAHNLSHAYLYVHKRDYDVLNRYSESWLARHLVPMSPIVFKNNEVTIYNLSSVSFPQPNSTTALVIPFDDSIDTEERWLYAYDVLSLGGYNYTVVYDLDQNIFSYDILILSFDPPQKNIIRGEINDNFTRKGDWDEVSGTWRYIDGGLIAGKRGEYQDAIILSPLNGQNFTASVSFKLMDGDLKVANYVSIIYDWRDRQNFKYAGLMFDGSGIVYAHFSSCKGGEITTYPSWPGLNTGLKWKFGDSFNITISAQGNMLSLFVNGTQYLSKIEEVHGGRLGIRVTRFYEVLFSGFKAEANRFVQFRDGDEYLEYVRNGGRLIVLNTNGYGYFANRMLNYYNGTGIKSGVIDGSQSVKMPSNIFVPSLYPKAGVETISYYISQEDSVPYVLRKEEGLGEIIYVNVYPIIEAMRISREKYTFYNLLGELLKPVSIQLERFKYTPPPIIATFKEVQMLGDIWINTSSIIFPVNVNFKKVEIIDKNGKALLLTNVTKLTVLNYGNVSIISSDLTLSEGNGFYSNLKFKGNVTIIFYGNFASVNLTTKNGGILRIDNVKTIMISPSSSKGEISVYTFRPTISLKGTAYFKELYSSATLKTRTYGQDLKVNGTVRLKMYLSDVYHWASSLDISGNFKRFPPLISYDELTSLPQAGSLSIILAPIFIAAILITYHKKKLDI
jgi:hypothetical protein